MTELAGIGEGEIGVFGIGDDTFVRKVTGYVGSVNGSNTRDLSIAPRSVTGSISQVDGSVSRSVTFPRDVTGYTQPIDGSLSRSVALALREVTGYVGALDGSVSRTITSYRTLTGYVGHLDGSATRTATYSRSVAGYLATIDGLAGYLNWLLSETPIDLTAVTATPNSLEVTIPTNTESVKTTLDTVDANAGNVNVRERADGTLEGLDTSGGSNTYTLVPSINSDPPRTERTVLADDIAREKSGPSGQTITADITLVPTETRDPNANTDADDTSQWRFDFAPGGRITTNRVAAQVNDDRDSTTATLVLEPLQAQTLETTTAAVAGAVSQSVPDGESLDRDTTPNSRQTVTITPPDAATDPPITSGDYLVLGWTTVGQGEGSYKVEIELTSL